MMQIRISCNSLYIFILGGDDIYWKSKRQQIIVISIVEAKLTALASASKEPNRLRELLWKMSMRDKPILHVLIHYYSNRATGM